MLQNVHRTEGDIAYIVLTHGQETMIDAEDLNCALCYRWYASYVPHMQGYYARATAPGGKRLMLHRVLMEPGPSEWVDHINHNTLDNRRSNLRCVSPSENAHNRLIRQPDHATGVLGVMINQKPDGRRYYLTTVKRSGVAKHRLFPFTPEGLAAATALVEQWRKDFTYEPDRTPREHAAKRWAPRVRSRTGVRGVSVQKGGYAFRCFSKHCPAYQFYPLTEEGLRRATAHSEEHHATHHAYELPAVEKA